MRYLLILLIAIIFFSCQSKQEFKLTYVVFYPNHNDTVSTSYIGRNGYYFGSQRGSNFISEEQAY